MSGRIFALHAVAGWAAVVLLMGLSTWTEAGKKSVSISGDQQSPGAKRWVPWERFTIAAGDEHDFAHPVASTTRHGGLVVALQRHGDHGDSLCVVRGNSDGQNWTLPQVIHQADNGWELLPTGMGQLDSDRLIVCAVSRRQTVGQLDEVQEQPAGVPRFHVSGYRMETRPLVYFSDDQGRSWTGGHWEPAPQLSAVTPCGHLLEKSGSIWLLAHGPANQQAMNRQISSLTQWRSDDAGRTWRYVNTIFQGELEKNVSYGLADWARLPDQQLTLLVEIHDPSRGQGISPRIARSISNDEGKSWTAPVKTLVGPRPSLARLASGSILCATSDDDGIEASMSHDGGYRWSELLYIRSVIHYRGGQRGGSWLTRPTENRIFGVCHWMHSGETGRTEVQGFFIRRQQANWPPGWSDQRYQAAVPIAGLNRWQMMEAEIVRPNAPQANAGLAYQSLLPTEQGRWLGIGLETPPGAKESGQADGKILAYLDDELKLRLNLMTAPRVEGPWKAIARVPYKNQFANLWTGMVRLRSGRLLVFTVDSNEGQVGVNRRQLPGAPRGQYWYETIYEGEMIQMCNGISISDDDGKSWSVHYPLGETIRVKGRRPACLLFDRGHLLELPDGTLARTCQVWLNEDHHRRGLISSIVIRSRDGGVSWSDASLIAEANEEDAVTFREPHLVVLPAGRWAVMLRLESLKWGDLLKKQDIFLSQYISWSSDQGYSWTPPRSLVLGAEPEAEVLTDGTLMVSARKFNQSYFWLSDDGGETFFRQEAVYEGPELAPGRRDIVGTPRPLIVN